MQCLNEGAGERDFEPWPGDGALSVEINDWKEGRQLGQGEDAQLQVTYLGHKPPIQSEM
jgi:hypothetical protein